MNAVVSRATLTPVLAGLPMAVHAQGGWVDLPAVLGKSILLIVYVRAIESIWWLIGLTAIAWGYHHFVGAKAGHTRSDAGSSPPAWRKQTPLEKVSWLLPRLHLGLLSFTVMALAVIALGKAMGLEYVAPSTSFKWPGTYTVQSFPKILWDGQSPNRQPWPQASGYISGMVLDANAGRSTILLDNTRGEASLYAKLCVASPGDCIEQRYIFVQAGSTMALENVSTGRYDVRFVDLNTRFVGQSEQIIIRYQAEDYVELDLMQRGKRGQFREISLEEF